MPVNSLFSAGMVDSAGVGDLEALQRELARLQLEVDPNGGLRDTMTLAVGMLHRYGTGIAHFKSGRYRNSLFWDVQGQGDRVIGYMATNLSYSIFEERRGGTHATFARTVHEEGRNVNNLFHMRVTGGQS